MVEVSADEYRGDLNSQIVLQPRTPQGRNDAGFESERSYFEDDARKRRCGTSPTAFWILIAVSALAIGGVIAGVLVNKHKGTAR